MHIPGSGKSRRESRIAGLALWALAALVLSPAGPAAGQEATAGLRKPALQDFLGGPDLEGVSLSPNGRYMLATRIEGHQHILTVTDLDSGTAQAESFPLGVAAIDWASWVDDNSILLRTDLNFDYVSQDEKTYKAVMSGKATYMPTLMTFEVDTQELKKLVPGGYPRFAVTNQGQITDFLPGDPDHVLLMANLDKGNDLFRLNIRDGRIWRVAEGSHTTYAFATDRNGRPVFRFNLNSRGSIVYIYAREDKPGGKISWRKIKTVRMDREGSNFAAPEFEALYPGPTPSTYYVAARPEGADTTAIYLYDIGTDQFVEKISTQTALDVQSGLFDTEARELEGVFYYDDRMVVEMQTPEMQAIVDTVRAQVGEDLNILPIDRNAAGDRWLFATSGPSDYGSYYLYDTGPGELRLFGHRKKSLAGVEAPVVDVVEYTARDGLPLKGYLSRPASAGPGEKLPLIMMPHGGPEDRDTYRFDRDVQVLVAQGYQVFQPNFRGSSGYGQVFANRGRRQWGRAMQTDIDDAYDHLVALGLAEEGKACIFGYSYGGYAALAAATLTPDKYRCILAAAGPSDLIAMLKWERKEEGGDSEVYRYWVGHMGDPKQDKAELEAVSPALQAARVTRPVLLLHGKDDGVVPVSQSQAMYKALVKAGKDVRYVELASSGHGYRTDADNLTYYTEILAFLERNLPAD